MARYYINRLGRFSSPDPLDNLSNSFAYVNNDPVNATDPLGLWCLGEGRCATHDEGFLGINEFDLMRIPITTTTWGAIFIGPQDLGTVAFPGGTMTFRILSGFGFYTQTLGTAMDWLSMLIGPGDDQKNPNDKDKPCPSSSSSLVNMLPHGGGVLFSGSAEGGVGQTGATAQGSVSLGGNNLFVDNNGNVSTGTFVSGAAVAYSGDHVVAAPAQTKVSPPAVVGAYAGVGGYFFLTNAQSAYQESGPFATVNLNIGVGPKLSFTFSYDPSSKVWLFGVNPPPLGYGWGLSGSVVTTKTHVFDFKNNGCH
jgi:hypothetical protein